MLRAQNRNVWSVCCLHACMSVCWIGWLAGWVLCDRPIGRIRRLEEKDKVRYDTMRMQIVVTQGGA